MLTTASSAMPRTIMRVRVAKLTPLLHSSTHRVARSARLPELSTSHGNVAIVKCQKGRYIRTPPRRGQRFFGGGFAAIWRSSLHVVRRIVVVHQVGDDVRATIDAPTLRNAMSESVECPATIPCAGVAADRCSGSPVQSLRRSGTRRPLEPLLGHVHRHASRPRCVRSVVRHGHERREPIADVEVGGRTCGRTPRFACGA